MSEETTTQDQRPVEGARSESAEAWSAVVTELDSLGDAIKRWAKAAVADPDNRRRMDELGDRLQGLLDDVGSAVRATTDSDVGQSFREAADKTGDAFRQAGERISEEVGPRLAGTFKGVGERLREAAERMERKAAGGDVSPPPDGTAPPERQDA